MKALWRGFLALLSCFLCCFCITGIGGTLGGASLKHSQVGRSLYILLLGGVSLLAWIFFNLPAWIDSAHYLTTLPGFRGCSAAVNSSALATPGASAETALQWIIDHEFGDRMLTVPQRLCFGALSAYRLFFALAVMHALLALVMVGAGNNRRSLRYEVQHGWWLLKMGLLALLALFAFFVLDDHFMYGFSWVAFAGSLAFIFVQIVLMIEFAHATSEKIARAAVGVLATSPDDSSSGGDAPSRASCLLVGTGAGIVVAACYVLALAFLVMSYANAAGCPPVAVSTTVTLVLGLVISCCAFLAMRTQRGGLLPAGIVVLYAAYLTWSAFSPMALADLGCIDSATATEALVGTDTTLNRVIHFATLHDLSRDAQQGVLLGAALIVLIYATARTAATAERFEDGRARAPPGRNLEMAHVPPPPSDQGDVPSGDAEDDAPYSYSWFHTVVFLATLYAAMVLTGWNQLSSLPHTVIYANGTAASAWVKLGSAWLTLLLYIWTVFVSALRRRCCPRL